MNERDKSSLEPEEAFPYKPPTDEIKKKYGEIFEIENALPMRIGKVVFDKFFALVVLVAAAPLLLLVWLAYKIEGIIIPSHRGPVFYFYDAISAGVKIRKYKIRVIRLDCIDENLAAKHD